MSDPTIGCRAAATTPPPSATSTTSGASTSSRPCRSPPRDRGQEPLDDRLLLGPVHLHPRPARGHVLPRAVGDLPHGGRRLADRLRDLVVRHVEHLAQHEHRPLGRVERLQHGEHRDRDALGELDVVGHVGAGEQRLGQPLADVVLAPPRQRAQPVERLPGDDPDEVGPRVAHLGPTVVAQVRPPQPGLLHDVLGVGRGAEHLVRDREEQAAVGDEGSSVMPATLRGSARASGGRPHDAAKPSDSMPRAMLVRAYRFASPNRR